ncbi:hypothetical protein Avbf_02892 [Armadillidium vulgare]|nr:hypothetical protein Avbf_02892 [Armadillidium vulgare]
MNPENLLTSKIIEESIKIDFGTSDVKLLSWNQNNCSAVGDNFFNVVKRIEVQCSIGGIEKEVTYVAKLNPCKTEDLFNPYRERAMLKEVFFYKELLPLLNLELKKMGSEGLHVPRYIHSSIISENEVIILEDLRPKGFITSKKQEMDHAHSEILAREIAKLHAASMSLEETLKGIKLDEKFPLLIESWLVGEEKLRNAFDGVFKKGLRLNLRLINALEEYDDSDTPVDVMIFDWQTVRVANVGSEISYLLFSSYFGPPRTKYFSPIINAYYDKLQNLLGTKSLPPLQDLENEVKNNQFGFLICFYLFPLSLCVSDPSELFKIEKEDIVDEDERLGSAKELLRSNERLNFVLKDYLTYFENNLNKFTF